MEDETVELVDNETEIRRMRQEDKKEDETGNNCADETGTDKRK